MHRLPPDMPLVLIDGRPSSLGDYEGRVLLVVNTASQCGFTPQYEGLESLHRRYCDDGLAILVFPCDQFGQQEPGSAGQIASFCEERFDISFPLHEKIQVNGSEAHPLFKHLKNAAPGLLGSERIKWNFTKFLVSRTRLKVRRYSPITRPSALVTDIEDLLAEDAPMSGRSQD